MRLTSINIYPVKSLAGFSVQSALVERRGLRYDRRWMLINSEGRFMTQRETAQMALLGTAIEGDFLHIFDRNKPNEGISVPLNMEHQTDLDEVNVTIWDDACVALLVSSAADAWLTERLGMAVRLVYMPEHSDRPADAKYVDEAGQQVSFADGYPFLLIGEASLADLNTRLETPVPMNRFRPNFVVEGSAAYEEEAWRLFSIGDQSFRGVKPCARCVVTTIDQDTAVQLKEPLRTLSIYRRVGNKVLFGQNVIWLGEESGGVVRVGDVVTTIPHNTGHPA